MRSNEQTEAEARRKVEIYETHLRDIEAGLCNLPSAVGMFSEIKMAVDEALSECRKRLENVRG